MPYFPYLEPFHARKFAKINRFFAMVKRMQFLGCIYIKDKVNYLESL